MILKDEKNLYFGFIYVNILVKNSYKDIRLRNGLRTKNMEHTEKNIFYNNPRNINFELNRI